MSKILFSLIVVLGLTLTTAQNEVVTTMQDHAQDLVKEIKKEKVFNYEVYSDFLVELKTLKSAANDPEIIMSDRTKSQINGVTKEKYTTLLKDDHRKVLSRTKAFKIRWDQVRYVDLLSIPVAIFKLGQPGHKCLLIIQDASQKDVLFSLRMDYIIIKNEPYLLKMTEFKKQYK